MKAYSLDLRERVMEAVEELGYTDAEAAEQYEVSERSIARWRKQYAEMGSYAPKPHAGGPRCKLIPAEATIRMAVEAQPDISLAALCAQVARRHQLTASASMMCRALAKLKLPLKKPSTLVNKRRRGFKPNAPPTGKR
jgi:transposase